MRVTLTFVRFNVWVKRRWRVWWQIHYRTSQAVCLPLIHFHLDNIEVSGLFIFYSFIFLHFCPPAKTSIAEIKNCDTRMNHFPFISNKKVGKFKPLKLIGLFSTNQFKPLDMAKVFHNRSLLQVVMDDSITHSLLKRGLFDV